MTASPAKPPHPLTFHNFRAYLAGRLCFTLAQSAMMIVLGWQTYNIARLEMGTKAAAAQLGLVGLAQFLPLFFLTPVSGWVADRFERRLIVRFTMVLFGICTAILGVATYEGWVNLPLIFSVATLLGVVRAFNGPAMGALAANIIPRDILPSAIALSSAAWQCAAIVGPAVGGYVYAIEPFAAYLYSGSMAGIALVMLMLIGKVDQPAHDRRRHPIRQMLDGIAYVRGNRLVLAAITLDLFAVLLAGATALLPVYARDILQVGSRGLGHLAAAPAVGAAVTALYFSVRPLKSEVGLKMLVAVIVFGLATVSFGMTAFVPRGLAMPMALASMVVWGCADMFSVYVRTSLIQLHTPDEMRGRVQSVSQMTISASNELGEAESGFLAALVGPVTAVVAGGVGAIIITILWARLFPELRLARSFDPPDIRKADPEHQPR